MENVLKENPSVNIRVATTEDAPAIARIHVETWRSAYKDIIPAPHLRDLSIGKRTQGWKRNLLENRDSVLVAEMSGVVVGWISFGGCRDDGDAHEAEVYALYLDTPHQKKGYGLALMQAAESRLKDITSATRISVWVLEKNEEGRRFYEKIGYTLGTRKKQEPIGGKVFTELRYEKLTPSAPV